MKKNLFDLKLICEVYEDYVQWYYYHIVLGANPSLVHI